MSKQYVTVLEESLEKKLRVLEEIYRICQQQEEALAKEDVDLDDFDRYVESKDICIEKLDKLDEGFEILYERVSQELVDKKEAYAKQIKHMQELITKIMDRSTSIQALEERNKKAIENALSKERKELRQGKRSLNAAMSYYRNMSGAGLMTSRYMDKKK